MRAALRIALSVLALASFPVAGCTPKPPIEEGRLVIAFPGAPSGIDPRLSTDAYGTQILQMTHASLLRLDASGNPVPELAEGWEERSPTEIVFRLRNGVQFHDGRELTSADVRYTFEWILDPANRSPHRTTYDPIRSIETPDPRTVIFRLSEPFAPFLVGMTRGIVPAGSPAAGYSPPIGAGPYRVDDYQQDAEIRLSRFEGYFAGPPRIETIVVKFLPDSNVRFLELRKGSVNFVLNGVDPDLIPSALA
ncbi:MAG TPA: ABC transporter substrate-binding protein, partial [Candidatus Deferrimicrobiaceae bacterium]|nr:ABC transporter substrate-binding protein [Candidatus Deferrimicrobiaceae bacterium]